jgi:DNA-binding NarL/FixJ family response regulator
MAKVVVVDDRPMNRELVVDMLVLDKHEVFEASDGFEGLDLVRKERPQVVISDILMPTMDGYEFVRRLRAEPAIAHTEVIFYTAHYREREAQNLAEACGVFRVLVKPCEPEDILRAVDEALESRRVDPAPVAHGFVNQHVRLLADQLFKKTSELRSMEQRLFALHELNLQFAQEDDPSALLGHFCRGARDLTGAKYAMLAVKASPGGAPFTSVSGMDPDTAAGLSVGRVASGALGQVYSERRSRRFTGALAEPGPLGLPRGFPEFRFALAAPILTLHEAFGWICLVDKPGADDFDADDELFLISLGAQVGRLYEKRLLYVAALQELTRLRIDLERRKEAEVAVGELAEKLSANEREIVRMVAEGKSTMEVAQSLVLSPRTVEAYRARVMHKLEIPDLPSLVRFAIRSGITSLDTTK